LAELSKERISRFREAVREALYGSRLAVSLFKLVNAYRFETKRPDGEIGWFGFDRLFPKGMFVESTNWAGEDMVGSTSGAR